MLSTETVFTSRDINPIFLQFLLTSDTNNSRNDECCGGYHQQNGGKDVDLGWNRGSRLAKYTNGESLDITLNEQRNNEVVEG